jgi:hypothetical protein
MARIADRVNRYCSLRVNIDRVVQIPDFKGYRCSIAPLMLKLVILDELAVACKIYPIFTLCVTGNEGKKDDSANNDDPPLPYEASFNDKHKNSKKMENYPRSPVIN